MTSASAQERVEKLRRVLEEAKRAEPSEREGYIKRALGEVTYLSVQEGPQVAQLEAWLTDAASAPKKEIPYYLNRASESLEDVDEDLEQQGNQISDSSDVGADETEPPESVRWIDGDHGVVELELTRPFIEWMELEANENNFDSVEKWVQTQLWISLTGNLQRDYGFTTDVEIELPHDYAQRAALWYAHRKVTGEIDEADLDAFLFNHLEFHPTWTLDGEPWDLPNRRQDTREQQGQPSAEKGSSPEGGQD